MPWPLYPSLSPLLLLPSHYPPPYQCPVGSGQLTGGPPDAPHELTRACRIPSVKPDELMEEWNVGQRERGGRAVGGSRWPGAGRDTSVMPLMNLLQSSSSWSLTSEGRVQYVLHNLGHECLRDVNGRRDGIASYTCSKVIL